MRDTLRGAVVICVGVALIGACGESGHQGSLTEAVTATDGNGAVVAACHGSYRNHGQCNQCVVHAVKDAGLKGAQEKAVREAVEKIANVDTKAIATAGRNRNPA